MDKVLDIIKKEFEIRVIDESLQRVIQCLNQLSHKEVWHSANANTNSVGNLVLHLEGNIRQYIISGVGGQEDVRNRPDEFVKDHSHSAKHLTEHLSLTLTEANATVEKLSYDQLSDEVSIQGFPHTRLSAIIHVIEHLSYHVGQITYYTKLVKDVDTGYYAGANLDVVG